MARMFPANGPAIGTTSDAERRVYYSLKQLDDNYYVFHSIKWHDPDRKLKEQDGEVDFVIVHPLKGIILFEVKGGNIHREQMTGTWYSTDRFQNKHLIQPFAQVVASTHTLVRYIKRHPSAKRFSHRYLFTHGVWFTDMLRVPMNTPELHDNFILFLDDLQNPEKALDGIYQHLEKDTPKALDEEMIQCLIDVFAPEIAMESALTEQIYQDKADVAQLTLEQAQRFWQMRRYPHLLVSGGAGTGKTVLAYEIAWRLAKKGDKVLLLNYTEFQAKWLQQKYDTNLNPNKPQFEIHDLKSLCLAMEKKTKVSKSHIESLKINISADQEQMSNALLNTLNVLKQQDIPLQYDAILVDEAQDIEGCFWNPIHHMLKDPMRSHFYIFYDDAQRVDFAGVAPLPTMAAKWEYPLTENCRNTQTIYNKMRELNPLLPEYILTGRPGQPIQYIDLAPLQIVNSISDDANQKALSHTLDVLIKQEGIRPDEILIITCRSMEKSCYPKWDGLGGYSIKPLRKSYVGCVKVSTIRSAKGLESKIVILIELDGIANISPQAHDKLLYLAISRAQYHLIVLGTPSEINPAVKWQSGKQKNI